MYIASTVLIALIALSAHLAANAETPPKQLKEGSSYVIGPNDRITVRCLNAEEFPASAIRVDSDGQITLPFVGRVRLAGLTVSEAERQLTTQLSKFILHPEVALNVVESHSQPVSVFGAVNSPGTYQLEGRKTLTEILSMAGGLRRDAGRTLKLTRRTEWGPIPLLSAAKDATGDFTVAEADIEKLVHGNTPSANIEVRPYDVISIPPAELVYVVGQVRKPGGFTITGREDLTILQAVALAEGLDRTAAPRKARILRKTGSGSRLEIPVDLDTVMSGRAPDEVLQPNDVLFVPNNTAKSVGMKTLDTVIQLTTGIIVYGRY